ncbi:MAG: cation:proton antiporter [Nitrososphaerota archaeon]|jgi:cell volume regulation protein A|nr:cation:proton antiporter [Nitrososphaerota archaeon]MDG6927097.1 cation:proton antiporter [Nitrososphaerota archaeon]MDG6929896.1 cation:proton antiporter [Nitrososphaerota archaeon]MDG6932336.1 cation:proton antiporter [Nitrososphaerota archaeon]MDG6935895.1 cation:proton antiporter [Nitrososphaerota archaeon]
MLLSYSLLFIVAAAIIFIGFFGEVFFKRTGIAESIFLIFIGILFGPIFKVFPYSLTNAIIPYISQLTLAMIMFELGIMLNAKSMVSQGLRATVRTIIYVFLSVFLIYVIFRYALNWNSYSSLFLASIVGGETTTTIVPYIAKHIGDERLFANITLESVLNSIFLIVIFYFVLGAYLTSTPLNIAGAEQLATSAVSQISIGFLVGIISGIVWVEFMKAFGKINYVYIATIGYVLLIYSMVTELGGSSILAVLMLGIILSNSKQIFEGIGLKHEVESSDLMYIKQFQGEISFFLRTFFYFFLGLVISIKILNYIFLYLFVLLVMLVLMGVRYFATNVTVGKDMSKYKKAIFMMMAQGLTPAVLSTIAIYYNIPNAQLIVSITAFVIIITNIVTVVGARGLKPDEQGQQ